MCNPLVFLLTSLLCHSALSLSFLKVEDTVEIDPKAMSGVKASGTPSVKYTTPSKGTPAVSSNTSKTTPTSSSTKTTYQGPGTPDSGAAGGYTATCTKGPWSFGECTATEQCLLDTLGSKCTADLQTHADESVNNGIPTCMIPTPPDVSTGCSIGMTMCSIAAPQCWLQLMCYDPCVCPTWKDDQCGTLQRNDNAQCTWAYNSQATSAHNLKTGGVAVKTNLEKASEFQASLTPAAGVSKAYTKIFIQDASESRTHSEDAMESMDDKARALLGSRQEREKHLADGDLNSGATGKCSG